jgi:hypothetical protein
MSASYSDDSMSDGRVPTTSSDPRHEGFYTAEELKSRGIANVEIHRKSWATETIIIKTWPLLQEFIAEHLTDGVELE